jgi:hypothetical protein
MRERKVSIADVENEWTGYRSGVEKREPLADALVAGAAIAPCPWSEERRKRA